MIDLLSCGNIIHQTSNTTSENPKTAIMTATKNDNVNNNDVLYSWRRGDCFPSPRVEPADPAKAFCTLVQLLLLMFVVGSRQWRWRRTVTTRMRTTPTRTGPTVMRKLPGPVLPSPTRRLGWSTSVVTTATSGLHEWSTGLKPSIWSGT